MHIFNEINKILLFRKWCLTFSLMEKNYIQIIHFIGYHMANLTYENWPEFSQFQLIKY